MAEDVGAVAVGEAGVGVGDAGVAGGEAGVAVVEAEDEGFGLVEHAANASTASKINPKAGSRMASLDCSKT